MKKQKKEMKRAEEKEAKRRKSLELKARATELVKAEAEAKKKQEEEAAAARSKMAPMTKEMWDKQQSVVRKVYDEDTGRTRLVKGDGEILEECVSASRHKEINKQATEGDGQSFQNSLNAKILSTSNVTPIGVHTD